MQLKRGLYKLLDRKKFTLSRYEEFLKVISKYKVLPLNEFRNYHNENEVVIGLRFDCDSNFEATMDMCRATYAHGIKGTVFVLHTAKYFTNPTFTMDLYKLQNAGFEIGLHTDIMSEELPPQVILHGGSKVWRKVRFQSILKTLRKAGVKIIGTSAHGDKHHKNIEFWQRYNKEDFGIEYESYELDHSLYFSDCTFIDKHRWHPLDINWNEIKPGSRIQILIHPETWNGKIF